MSEENKQSKFEVLTDAIYEAIAKSGDYTTLELVGALEAIKFRFMIQAHEEPRQEMLAQFVAQMQRNEGVTVQ